jgi:hypothetical protein
MNFTFELLGNVTVRWDKTEEIKKMFRNIIDSRPSKLFKMYFERMLIMNNQHFKYLVKQPEKEQK